MTQLPCDIVQDLLPLYEDNVCSDQSKDSVEEHLSFCDKCRHEYEVMHEKLPRFSEEEESAIDKDVEFIKKINKKLTFKHFLILGITLLIVCIFFSFTTPEMEPLFYLSSDNVEIAELYRLKNGDIYCTFESDRTITLTSNNPVVVPREKEGHDYDNGWTEIALHSNPFHHLEPGVRLMNPTKKLSFVFTLKKEEYTPNGQITTQKSNSIYLIGKYNKRTLIWKEGENIASAPKAIEDKVIAERARKTAFLNGMTEEEILISSGHYNDDLYIPFLQNE